MVSFIAIVALIFMVYLFSLGTIGILIDIGIVIFFVIYLKNDSDKTKIEENKNKNREKESINIIKEKYTKVLYKANLPIGILEIENTLAGIEDKVYIPKNAFKVSTDVTILGDKRFYYNKDLKNFYLWENNKILYILPAWFAISASLVTWSYDISRLKDPNDITLTTIPLEKVESYRICGNLSTSSYTSSGRSSGINIKGAVKGAVIAGGVGTIIGGQKSTEPTTTSISTDDERYVLLKYFNDNDNSQEIKMSLNAFDLLREWIPEKEFDFIIQQKQNDILKEKAIKNSIKNNKDNKEIIKQKLKDIADLKNEDLISNEEYNLKKQEIINSI